MQYWHVIPLILIILSILFNLLTFLGVLFPLKTFDTRLTQRLRYGIGLLSGIGAILYTAVLEVGIGPEENLVCAILVILVHGSFLTVTLWLFLNTLNGSYDIMGLTGRLRGQGLNKLMVSLHAIPGLVMFISLVLVLVEYNNLHPVPDPMKPYGNHGDAGHHDDGTGGDPPDDHYNDDNHQNDDDLTLMWEASSWVHPINYWLTWVIPSIALLLFTLINCLTLARTFKLSRLFSCRPNKGSEVCWIRHTIFICLFFVAASLTVCFSDYNPHHSEGFKIFHQFLFSLTYFFFSFLSFYSWVLWDDDVIFFWLQCDKHASLECLTCGCCILDPEIAIARAESQSVASSAFFVNVSALDPENISLASSVCSTEACRHVNEKCRSGGSSLTNLLQLEDKQFGVDRRTLKRTQVPDEETTPNPKLRERQSSRVSFNDEIEVIREGTKRPQLTVNIDKLPKSIIRTSNDSTPVHSESVHTDTPIPSPEDPIRKRVTFLSSDGFPEEDNSCTPSAAEKAAALERMLGRRQQQTDHHPVHGMMSDYERHYGAVEVKGETVYTPTQETVSFAEHLQNLSAALEKIQQHQVVREERTVSPPPPQRPSPPLEHKQLLSAALGKIREQRKPSPPPGAPPSPPVGHKEPSPSPSPEPINFKEPTPSPSPEPVKESTPPPPRSPAPKAAPPVPIAPPVPMKAPHPAFDLLYPTRSASSSESSTPTLPSSSAEKKQHSLLDSQYSDAFETPPEGSPSPEGSPRLGRSASPEPSTVPPPAQKESPMDFLKKVFGPDSPAGSDPPSLD